jgi:hypothetical protein
MSKTRPILRPRGPLSFSKSVDAAVRGRLPELEGAPVRILFLPALSAAHGKLYSKRQQGQPVHAATFIRRREIILDDELRGKPKELARILTHELFHFAWVRLSNQARVSYERILLEERQRHARGELGWSAEWRKAALPQKPPTRSPNWRDYVCESFCDTAAWLYGGIRRHEEFTLAARHSRRRAEWFRSTFQNRGIPI